MSASSSQTIIFPLKEGSNNVFSPDFYQPEMTSDKVSLEEVNQFTLEISDEYKLYQKNVADQKFRENCFEKSTVITFFVDIYLLFADSRDDFLGLFTKGEIIFLSLFLYLIVASFCFGISDPKNFLCQLRDKCQDRIDQQNEILRSRDLKWHLPDLFPIQIELTKDMEKKNNHLTPIRSDLPQTTQNRIIFPLQYFFEGGQKIYNIYRFSPDSFSPNMVDGQISGQEVQELLFEINSLMKIPPKEITRIAFIALFGTLSELFAVLYAYNHFPDLLTTLQAILIAVILITVTACIASCVIEREMRKLFMNVETKCRRAIDRHNLILQGRGLKWQTDDHKFLDWIELCKISSNQDPNSQPIDILPENQEPPANPEDDLEAGNQNVDKNSHKKVKNDAYVPLNEEEDEKADS